MSVLSDFMLNTKTDKVKKTELNHPLNYTLFIKAAKYGLCANFMEMHKQDSVRDFCSNLQLYDTTKH